MNSLDQEKIRYMVLETIGANYELSETVLHYITGTSRNGVYLGKIARLV